MLKAYNFSGGVVTSRPDQMYGWPGLTRVKEGELLVLASERKHHVCPFGREVIIRSMDGGRTWGLPQEIYNSELDDRDSTIVTMPDGTVVAAWFTFAWMADPQYFREEWQARSDRVTDKILEEVVGDWLIRSNDGGHTWEKLPHRMPDGGAAHTGPFVLSDGSLVCFGYEMAEDGGEMFFYKSEDKGERWSRIGKVPCREKIQMNETWRLCRGKALPFPCINERSLLELSPDRFIVMFRNSKYGRLTQSHSLDGGRTWSELEITPIVGKPPHLLKLNSGELLCTYGHRAEPWSVRAVLSYDEGKTWDADNVITIDTWEDKPDMGYPVSLEVNPRKILTVYYCSRQPIKHLPGNEKTYKRGSTPEGILFKRYILR